MALTGKAKPKNAGHDTPDVPGLLSESTKNAEKQISANCYLNDSVNYYFSDVAFRPTMAKPSLPFRNLSDEQYRVYDFGDHQVRLVKPMKLNVSESGGHRVFTADGVSHYIPSGWVHLYWVVKEGCPHFAF